MPQDQQTIKLTLNKSVVTKLSKAKLSNPGVRGITEPTEETYSCVMCTSSPTGGGDECGTGLTKVTTC
jgi:hypothetical protein